MLFLAQFVPSRVPRARIFCKRVVQRIDNNSNCEDCECDSVYVKHRSESVFEKSSDKEMSEMSILSRLHR